MEGFSRGENPTNSRYKSILYEHRYSERNPVRFLFIVLTILLACLNFTFADEMTSADFSASVYCSIAPFGVAQSTGWISADIYLASSYSDPALQESDAMEMLPGFLSYADYSSGQSPQFLTIQHTPYFVSVFNEDPTTFSVLFYDPYGNQPSTGYPRVTYWPSNTQNYVTVPLEFTANQDGSLLYTKQVSFSTGTYYYYYTVKNEALPDEYTLATSSFTISRRPQNIENKGIAEQSIVSNAKIVLKWDASDPEGSGLNYKLYVGNDPNNLPVLYEGTTAYYEITGLGFGTEYYWQVEATNIYGVTTKSSVYKFSTVSQTLVSKAFNYPNPFNPHRQKTNLVFKMAEDGSADISIYTELGDLCWQKTFSGLSAGANEIQYDGTDDYGQILYNGTYVCIFKKKYQQNEERDHCRLLIIK